MVELLQRLRRSRSGSSMVEFALTTPVVLVMAFGAGDLARIFVEAAVLAGASKAGVVYGFRSHHQSGDYAGMQAAAASDSTDVHGVSATSDRVCDCPDAPGVWLDCSQALCTSYGAPRVYVRTRTTKQFETLASYPGVTKSTTIAGESLLRVQ